jgi:hypothetical protein
MLNLGGVGGGASRRPPAVVCHICGRQYGTASITIHVKTCEKKFLEEEAKKPAKQRRALPEAAPDYALVAGATPDQLDRHNEIAFKQFNEAVLMRCENCGRTFLPDRLAIHHKSCTAANPARRVGEKGVGNGGAPFMPSAAASAAGNDDGDDGYDERPIASPIKTVGNAGTRQAQAQAPAAARPASRSGSVSRGRAGSTAAAPARGGGGGGGGGGAQAAEYDDDEDNGAPIPVRPSPSRGGRQGGPASSPQAAPAAEHRAGGGGGGGGGGGAAEHRAGASGGGGGGGGGGEAPSSVVWRSSVSSRLAELATRLAYLQETLLGEVQDIQQEVADIADEVAAFGAPASGLSARPRSTSRGAGAGGRPGTRGGAGEGKE